MHRCTDLTDLFALCKQGDSKAFEVIYDQYSDQLFRYVYSRVKEKETSEEIVQEIFVSLWTNRTATAITPAYLFVAAKNKVLSHMRSSRVRKQFAVDFTLFAASRIDNSCEDTVNLHDLQNTIRTTIHELPEYCQTAFRLSRIEHVSTRHIAEHMNISQRTVENYISKALRYLREALSKAMDNHDDGMFFYGNKKGGKSISHQV
jgi:RNA polymerase sigma-70 factor (ECF subfamily)